MKLVKLRQEQCFSVPAHAQRLACQSTDRPPSSAPLCPSRESRYRIDAHAVAAASPQKHASVDSKPHCAAAQLPAIAFGRPQPTACNTHGGQRVMSAHRHRVHEQREPRRCARACACARMCERFSAALDVLARLRAADDKSGKCIQGGSLPRAEWPSKDASAAQNGAGTVGQLTLTLTSQTNPARRYAGTTSTGLWTRGALLSSVRRADEYGRIA